MVEFTIAAPLLLLLLYAIVEFGNVFYQHALLADSVRNAARYLASNAITDGSGVVNISTATGATQNLVVYGNTCGNTCPGGGTANPLLPGLAAGQVTVTTQKDPDGSTDVIVSVAYPYQSLFGGSIPNFVATGSVNTAFTLNVFTSMHAL